MNIIKNKGFTITEIMISLLIASMVIINVVVVFETNIISANIQKEMVRTQNRTESAMRFVVNDVSNAGASFGGEDFEKNPFDWEETTYSENGNDSFKVVYNNLTENDAFTCGETTATDTIENRYRVVNGILYCNSLRLAGYVEKFKILFLADLNGDGEPDKLLTPDVAKTVSEDNTKRIVGAKIMILVSNSSPITNYKYSNNYKFKNTELDTSENKIYSYIIRHIVFKNMI